MTRMDRFLAQGMRAVRRLIVTVVGLTVLAVGVALLVLPGPAFVVIPIGLGILAIEFEWARRLLRRARDLYTSKPSGPAAARPADSEVGDRAASRSDEH